MVQWLSKLSACLVALLLCGEILAQNTTGDPTRGAADYKDPKSHEKFYKRRNIISAWQINQLKNGALVVRLKTNQMAIDELKKAGNTDLAREKELEAYVINKNTMTAFLDKYNFSKVYFINSNHSDTLLKGATSGIFLDTTLNINPSITMSEKFYLLAERDYGYNSSIGFVPEDSARGVIERGNPVKQMSFVIKNKYGHQLKNPFPYTVSEKNFMDATVEVPVTVGQDGSPVNYQVDRRTSEEIEKDDRDRNRSSRSKANAVVKIPKQYTYEKLAISADQLNENLRQFHQATPAPSESSIPADARPFLY